MLLKIANELLINKSQLARYLDTIDIIIFPCLNPDGYEYTKTNPQNPSVFIYFKIKKKNFLNLGTFLAQK